MISYIAWGFFIANEEHVVLRPFLEEHKLLDVVIAQLDEMVTGKAQESSHSALSCW